MSSKRTAGDHDSLYHPKANDGVDRRGFLKCMAVLYGNKGWATQPFNHLPANARISALPGQTLQLFRYGSRRTSHERQQSLA